MKKNNDTDCSKEEFLILSLEYKNGEVVFNCQEDILKDINAQKDDFAPVVKEIESVIANDVKGAADHSIVKMYLEVSRMRRSGEDEFEVTQRIKTRCNNKVFPNSLCSKINELIIDDIYQKLEKEVVGDA